MLTLNSLNLDNHLAIFLAVKFAERSLSVWEAEYPEDKRPQKAVEAAKSWLKDPRKEKAADDAAADAADDAAADAADAADAARAAYAAAYAAKASAYAAWAAANAYAKSAAWAANAAAAKSAASAIGASKKDFIHEVISQNLGYILKYKIEEEQGFSEPELIFEHLNEEGRNLLLFNLGILR